MMDKPGIFSISTKEAFETAALDIFRYQAQQCTIYKRFLSGLPVEVDQVETIAEIPFMPIEFFKSHTVITGEKPEEVVFYSSGTGGSFTSKHHVADRSLYEQSYRAAFAHFYGDIRRYALLALLPSYLERRGSSLIYMVDDLIKNSRPESGYFLHDHDALHRKLLAVKNQHVPCILMGVSYALLDFIDQYAVDFPDLIVMETGGMKGKRKEIIKNELHTRLKQGFGVAEIHAEYGMTELLSQAYSTGSGRYVCPPWMQVRVRDMHDPFSTVPTGKTGAINVIDLANMHSCTFIATQDLGKANADGSFEILGRFDHSDIRGCNLMIS